MDDFYVYLHVRLDNGEVFYVGKGRGRRARYFYERNSHWTRVYRKYGCEVHFFAQGLTEAEAFAQERTAIALFRSEYRTNKSDGGEGPSGYRFTPDQIARLRLSHTGLRASDHTIETSRQRMTGRIASERERQLSRERMIGNRHGAKRQITPELRQKLSRANSGGRSPHTDRREYAFVHKDGRVFVGTRWQLKEEHGDCVRLLFASRPNKSIYGWVLAYAYDS